MNIKKGVVPTSMKWNSSQIRVTDLLLSYLYVDVPREEAFESQTIGKIYEEFGDDVNIFVSKMQEFLEAKFEDSGVFIDNDIIVEVSPFQDNQYKGFTLSVSLPDRNKEISKVRLIDENGILTVLKQAYNNG